METVGLSNLSMFGAPGMPAAGYAAPLLDTGQTTCYSVFDDGDQEIGVDKGYTVNAIAGNSLIEVAHYAAATLAFGGVGVDEIQDAANGLVTFLTNDIIVVKGAATPANNAVYTVTAGGAADHMHVNPGITAEAAGAVVSLYKRAAHANAVVTDTKTGRMWSRNTSTGEKVGSASNGTLNWYDVATRYAIYNVANTVSCIVPGNIFRIAGGAGSTQFHVGDCIMVEGFANAVNLLPNYYITAAADNGANFDITVNPGNEVLIAEGAVGDTIYLNCRSIYNYMAGARLAGLSGYTDWRVPNQKELDSLVDDEAPTSLPDAIAFPGWPSDRVRTSTTRTTDTTGAINVRFDAAGVTDFQAKTSAYLTALVRN